VKAKKWESVEHFFRAGSSCSDDYGVSGVPKVLLVDTNGKVVFSGHPASRKLEEDIEKLMKGETLTGAGLGAEDAEEEEKGKSLDSDTLVQEQNKFQTEVSKFINEPEVVAAAASLQRDFIVLIREASWDSATNNFLTTYKNINVLVGPKASVDGLKSKIEGFLGTFKGNFESEWRVQSS
jgi:hypothetical protein